MSPHSANIDSPKLEQHCGGILTQWCRNLRTIYLAHPPTKTANAAKRGDGFTRRRKLLLGHQPADTFSIEVAFKRRPETNRNLKE
jgi:hypothetical protein